MKIGTAHDVRSLDQKVIGDYGVPQSVLMENAAIAAREVISRRWGIPGQRILLLCGTGNNGGDGLALARLLQARGAGVTVVMTGDPGKLSGAAAGNRDIVRHLPIDVLRLEASPQPALLNKLNFDDFDVIVDGIFGTGLSRDVTGPAAALIQALNRSAASVLSLDIPSGVNADSGKILGTAVRAEATVSFGIPKHGNLLYPGYEQGGRLYLSEISFPPEIRDDDSMILSVNIPPLPPRRPPNGHKGSFGKVLIVGGAPNYAGAPAFAALAALKTGAGYARLAVPSALASRIFTLVPEAVFLPRECGGGPMGGEHGPELLEQTELADSLVLGPGLSTAAESIRLARDLIAGAACPLIVDGDALGALAGREELSTGRKAATILTPHPGEMARLLGTSIGEVETRRIDCAREAAERYASVVVLKGAHSIIAEPSGRVWMNLTGNAGMGTAGSGDILAGVTGTMAAGMEALEAARLATWLHGLAGDLASEPKGEAGMTATDILEALPEALKRCAGELSTNPFSGSITLI